MATFQILLRNKPKADTTLPIVFKIYAGTKNKIITTPFSIMPNQWDERNKKVKSNHAKARDINASLRLLSERLENVIIELEAEELDYNLDDIVNGFHEEAKGRRIKSVTVFDYFTQRIKELESIDGFGYAKVIADSQRSLFKFAKNTNLRFKDITFEFLCNYETFLRKTCTDGGIKVKMTDIRTLYNLAINAGYALATDYPFKAYSIAKRLKSQSRKIALSKEDFEAFTNFDTEKYPIYVNTYYMFLFSYYTGGMNFKDMAYLQWSNIQSNRILYTRQKTNHNFNLPVLAKTQEILEYYRDYPKSEGKEYIFPVFMRDAMTEKQKVYRYKKCIRNFNKQLKFIAESMEIDSNITSYVSRHSQATHLKFDSVPTDVISQIMGHSDVSVTQAYLKEFDTVVMDEALKRLE